ncbi:MAG: hypothetical protein NT062_04640 [Proteobacteria bacterium]|nr:hypothetical protein [Pseudomonadota bacterium]
MTTTDETRGQPLGERMMSRTRELEAALAQLDEHETVERDAISLALANAHELTTGDLEHPSDVVARDLNMWLERHKYLGEEHAPPVARSM